MIHYNLIHLLILANLLIACYDKPKWLLTASGLTVDKSFILIHLFGQFINNKVMDHGHGEGQEVYRIRVKKIDYMVYDKLMVD